VTAAITKPPGLHPAVPAARAKLDADRHISHETGAA